MLPNFVIGNILDDAFPWGKNCGQTYQILMKGGKNILKSLLHRKIVQILIVNKICHNSKSF